MSINLTERAIAEIGKVMEEQKFSSDEYALEVGVSGGGCSGYTYKLGFKKKADVDKLNETFFTFEGVEAVVNNKAMSYIDGTTIDFHTGLNKRGFVFNNPQMKTGCGCGNSFSV